MSEQNPEAVELPRGDDAAFATLMDVLAPSEGDGPDAAQGAQGSGEGAAADGAAAGADGAAERPGTAAGDGASGATPGGPATGGAAAGAGATPDAGGTDAAGAGAAADGAAAAGGADGGADAGSGAGDRPATWVAPAADLIPKLGEISTALETRTSQAYQKAALEEVQTEHAPYFEALQKHPRLLVGTQVPAIGKEGYEVLRDAADAKDWQEAVKQLLVDEVKSRAEDRMEESSDFLSTVHASIDLFKNNSDLIPMTKDFDVELANRFATMAKPYELRVEGKLQGYSIPVQPIIDSLRTQLVAERAAKATAPAAPAGAPAPQAAPPAPVDPPQAGIQSKAGSGADDADDFSTLFGTIGLPNLRI